MKGVVLAGGRGTRLWPLTAHENKHLLPVGRGNKLKPMIWYPIMALRRAGLEDIMVVTGGEHAERFWTVLEGGRTYFGTSLVFGYQDRAGGIADALAIARPFVGDARVIVILGDNLFQNCDVTQFVQDFGAQERGARVIVKEVSNPSEYGVAEIAEGRIASIEEKPQRPKSCYAVLGAYAYPGDELFRFLPELRPSARGELEITDLNNLFIERSVLLHTEYQGEWLDAGLSIEAFEALHDIVARWELPGGRSQASVVSGQRQGGGRPLVL